MTCKARKPGWFCNLPEEALAEYDALSIHLGAPAGSTLFSEGQAPRGVSILCMGHVKLTKSAANGKTLLVRIAKPGDVLGLSAALSETPYEVTAEAIEPTQIKTFRREDFLKFLEHHTEGSINAASSLNTEYRAALADACRLSLSSSIAGRFAHLLFQMAIEEGTAEDAQPVLQFSLRHEDLASMLGTSRESITRILNDLKQKGIIAVSGKNITILNKSTLENML